MSARLHASKATARKGKQPRVSVEESPFGQGVVQQASSSSQRGRKRSAVHREEEDIVSPFPKLDPGRDTIYSKDYSEDDIVAYYRALQNQHKLRQRRSRRAMQPSSSSRGEEGMGSEEENDDDDDDDGQYYDSDDELTYDGPIPDIKTIKKMQKRSDLKFAAICLFIFLCVFYGFEFIHLGVLKFFAHTGDSWAQHIIAQKYHHGHVVEQDHDTAFAYMHWAADSGRPESMYNIAVSHFQNKHDRLTDQQALSYLQDASDHGLSEADAILGNIYHHGSTNISINLEKASYHYERAAKAGIKEAMHNLGVLHHLGKGGLGRHPELGNKYIEDSRNDELDGKPLKSIKDSPNMHVDAIPHRNGFLEKNNIPHLANEYVKPYIDHADSVVKSFLSEKKNNANNKLEEEASFAHVQNNFKQEFNHDFDIKHHSEGSTGERKQPKHQRVMS
eukprot:Nk52_evm8s207 gene=Nk52_evmTU8s207